jgi:putative transcriptional regulator
MKKSINEAVIATVQDMLNAELKSSFTKKELDQLGVTIPEISMTPEQIKKIRQKTKLSQCVFAKLLNVSLSSVRQWEQGTRIPTGATKVLLELLDKSPHILDYRISA